MNLRAAIANLEQDFDAIANTALADAADDLANQVRQALSVPPGGPHDHPWLQTGALRDSVQSNFVGPEAVVASTSEVAVYQEHGTATVPPRPTFGPVAAAAGHTLAQSIGQAVAHALGAK